jgi:uncharacterized protein (TIGR02246 family)
MIYRRIIPLLFIALSASVVSGQDGVEISPDEVQVRAAIDGYLKAINSGDASSAAEYWSETGQMVSSDGSRLEGKADIQKDLESYLNENQRLQVSLSSVSIRFLTPTVAMEEGLASIVSADAEPSSSTYQAIHVKKDGQWKLESLRETENVVPPSNHDQLKELAWMIGEWVDQDDATSIETSCQWTSNGNFMTRSFTVTAGDAIEMEGTQVIGWDPQRNQIRSWVFDSDGGFGEGSWTRSGDQWTVKNKFHLPDGRQGKSTNTFTYVDEDTFKWQSKNRSVGEERLPDVNAVSVNRLN